MTHRLFYGLTPPISAGMTTTLNYGSAGQLLSEVYSGGTLGGLSATNGYDHLLRRTNVILLGSGSTVLARSTNSFDAASRFQTIGDGTNLAVYSSAGSTHTLAHFSSFTFGVDLSCAWASYRNMPRKLRIQPGQSSPLRHETTLPLKAIAARLCPGTSRSANGKLHAFMNGNARVADVAQLRMGL